MQGGEAIEKIGYFLEWVVGTTRTGGVCLVVTVLTLAATFFLTSLQPVERLRWVWAQAS